jgi:hypothetical protein
LLEWFAEEDLDVQDAHGVTALFYAADYSCPEAVSVLIEWGADPLRETEVKLFMQATSLIHDGIDIARQTVAKTFGPYNFVLHQIYNRLVSDQRTNNQMRRARPFFNTSVPHTSHDDTMHKIYLKYFETLSALSYDVESVLELPNDIPAECKIKGLVPRTKKLRFEQCVDQDGNTSVEVWGVHHFNNGELSREISLHVGLLDKLSPEEVAAEIESHKARWTTRPGSSIVFALWGIDSDHLYRFLVTRLAPAGQEHGLGLAQMQISDSKQDENQTGPKGEGSRLVDKALCGEDEFSEIPGARKQLEEAIKKMAG